MWAWKESDFRSVLYQRTVLPLNYAPNNFHYWQHKLYQMSRMRTNTSHEQNKGCLYIDSETGLSVPVTFILPKKEGDDMHIEYVYGIVGSIEGMKVEKVNT